MSIEENSIVNEEAEVSQASSNQLAKNVEQIMAQEDVSVVVIYKNNEEQHKISGDKLVEDVEELIGNRKVSRIIISKANGETLIDTSFSSGLTMTVIAALLLPKVLGLGLIGALLARLKVEVVSQKTKAVAIKVNSEK